MQHNASRGVSGTHHAISFSATYYTGCIKKKVIQLWHVIVR